MVMVVYIQGTIIYILYNYQRVPVYNLCGGVLRSISEQRYRRDSALFLSYNGDGGNASLASPVNTTAAVPPSPPTTTSLRVNVSVYSAIVLALFVFSIGRALLTFRILVVAARTLHDRMFSSIVRCPLAFFDRNPVGE